jgi:hypothetical protein
LTEVAAVSLGGTLDGGPFKAPMSTSATYRELHGGPTSGFAPGTPRRSRYERDANALKPRI